MEISSPIIANGRKNRNHSLDIFRIISVYVIFLFHSEMHLSCNFYLFESFIKMGAIFMTAFFMLSGVVLSITYNDCDFDGVSIRKFLVKRIIRIMPIYLILKMPASLFYLKSNIVEYIAFLPVETLGIQSFFSSLFKVSHVGGSWFVSCLLFCYVFFPYLHRLISGMSARGRLCLLGLTVFILLWSPIVVHVFKTNSIYENPIFRMMEFFIGIMLVSLCKDGVFNRRIFTSNASLFIEIISLVLFVSLAYSISGIRNYMLYSWISLPIFMLLIVYCLHSKFSFKGNFSNKAVNFLCGISYVFFLIQYPVWVITRFIAKTLSIESNIALISVSTLVCFLLSSAVHEALEKPAVNFLKKRLT